ncbi:hypothetical protein AOQ84DRAFT_130029 [Glonium stellatum]|uniref:Uncharacterized protein n=1 Tax=Glonium stellatum TaxID=574774 RepID=A0A8E2FA05_9PEZI|nr:hypothetical protein AOQ84DRAFT_130029 [Glonium stellatum]
MSPILVACCFPRMSLPSMCFFDKLSLFPSIKVFGINNVDCLRMLAIYRPFLVGDANSTGFTDGFSLVFVCGDHWSSLRALNASSVEYLLCFVGLP